MLSALHNNCPHLTLPLHPQSSSLTPHQTLNFKEWSLLQQDFICFSSTHDILTLRVLWSCNDLCVWICMGMDIYSCVHLCVLRPRVNHWCPSLWTTPSSFVRQDLTGLVGALEGEQRRSISLHLPNTEISHAHHSTWVVMCGFWGSN